MKIMRTLGVACAALAALFVTADACSTFCFGSESTIVFGKNYDWNVSDGLIMVNPAGAMKTADLKGRPARWTSRYGSVTFNQYGREHPCGGINEAGLVVELMWLDETAYPEPDDRPAISTLQWIQYQLDNSGTVAEVLATDEHVRVRGRAGFIHFLIADATGAVASVEFIDGRLVAHTGASMPYRALTNDTYHNSLSYLETHEGYGGERGITRSEGSLDRFVYAADRAHRYRGERDGDPVTYAFETLEMVSQGDYTQWSIVYDIGARRVYARTRAHRPLRFLDLRELDFSCDRPTRFVDLQAPLEGDLREHLEPYSTASNLSLMRSAFSQTRFLAGVTDEDIRLLARYPETITCAPRERSSR